MFTNLDFLDIIQVSNGPFVFCRSYATIIAANPHSTGVDYPLSTSKSLLYRHLKQYHDGTQPAILPDLVQARLVSGFEGQNGHLSILVCSRI